MFGYIYVIENNVNNKLYIGQTSNLEQRIRKHFRNNRKDTAIGCAIRKYGAKCFDLSVIESCSSQEELDARESFWIEKLTTCVPYGYNLTTGEFCGGKHSSETSDEQKLKLRKVNLGKKLAEETKEKIRTGLKKYFEMRSGL